MAATTKGAWLQVRVHALIAIRAVFSVEIPSVLIKQVALFLFGPGTVVYCADYHCSHSQALSADRWPDEIRLTAFLSAF